MRKGQLTRQRLLDIAETGVLAKGFGATSIDEIIVEAEITKSGFFYHFKDKNELALALLQRYADTETEIIGSIFERANELDDDPLHSFLIGLKLLAEMMDDLPNGHPGCMVASICFSERLFDRNVIDLNRQVVLDWRKRFRAMLEDIAVRYPPRDDVDFDALADMISSVIDGGIILSKALGEPRALGKQVMLFRSYIALLFQPTKH
jgi:AcrR family transcriptional regulator